MKALRTILLLLSMAVVLWAILALLGPSTAPKQPRAKDVAQVARTRQVGSLEPYLLTRTPIAQRAEAREENSPTGRIIVEVHASDGSPSVGASVWILDSLTSKLTHGVTQADGVTSFPTDAEEFCVGVKGPDSVPSLRYFSRDAGVEPEYRVSMVIPQAMKIYGRVVDPRGAGIPDAQVLGLSATAALSPQRLELLLESGREALPLATSDANGEFELSIPANQTRLALIAGKVGFLGPTVWSWTHAASPITITIYPAYAALIRYESPIVSQQTDHWKLFQGGVFFDLSLEGLLQRPYQIASLQLSGLPLSLVGLDAWPNQAIIAMSADPEVESGEVAVWGKFPGTKDFRAKLTLRRISPELPITRLELQAEESQHGSVEITLARSPLIEHAWDSKRFAWGELHIENGEGRLFQAPVWEIDNEPMLLEGLPVGRYDLSFVSESSNLRLSLGAVDVTADAVTPLTADVSMVGALEIQLRTLSGLPYQSNATIRLRDRAIGVGTEAEFHFDGEPYILDLVPPGVYDLEVAVPGYEMARLVNVQILRGMNPGETVVLQEKSR